ncbi:hypothetical protein P9B03_04680 [Metasolibacillus meyeri]|uniref:Uncharacterized protein n=1 Tax=Metasolibacillus meyeri TaxID=1071052 RepID=A0AAW9NMT1_9BACL|nr:hypothetical protein [Metasolibacillus meyeri]MEC1177771.1 hypothetical protein [Metasolibacillus meyeri]
MRDENFNNVARKPLSSDIKEKRWQAVSVTIDKEKQKNRLSYYSVLIIFGCILFFFIQTLQTPQQIKEQTASVSELGTITEAIFLRNERPERILNLTSPLYIGRTIITNNNELEKLQQLFAQATLEPIERELSTYEYSQDLLLQFANGESRYVKVVAGSLFSPYEVIDMELKQRYVSEVENFPYEVTSIKYNNEDSNFLMRLPISFSIIGVTLLFIQRRKKKLKPTVVKGKIMIITGIITPILFTTPIMFGHYIFGAHHLGIIALCIVGAQVFPAYIYEKWGNVKADWFGLLLFLVSTFIAFGILAL